MRNDYYNGSHYPDPTAYQALMNIEREEAEQRRINKRAKKPVDLRRYRPVEKRDEK